MIGTHLIPSPSPTSRQANFIYTQGPHLTALAADGSYMEILLLLEKHGAVPHRKSLTQAVFNGEKKMPL